jgi:hypothetical protein
MFDGPTTCVGSGAPVFVAAGGAQRLHHRVRVGHAVGRPSVDPVDARAGAAGTRRRAAAPRARRQRVPPRRRSTGEPQVQPQFAAVGHLAETGAATVNAGQGQLGRQAQQRIGAGQRQRAQAACASAVARSIAFRPR